MNSVTVLGKIHSQTSISFLNPVTLQLINSRRLNPVTLKFMASQSCHAQVYGVSIMSRTSTPHGKSSTSVNQTIKALSLSPDPVYPPSHQSPKMLYSHIGAISFSVVREMKEICDRPDLVNSFIKETDAVLDEYVRRYPDSGYSVKQMTNIVAEFRTQTQQLLREYIIKSRSVA